MEKLRLFRQVLFFTLFVLTLVYAQTSPSTANLGNALTSLCTLFNQILPIAVLVVIVLAGVVFAVGQTMGAETRARANVWATNLLIGALIAGAVIIVAPLAVGTLLGSSTATTLNCK